MIKKRQDEEIKIKIILVGDSGVGKSNIRERFCQNKFDPFSNKTIGIQFSTRKFLCPYEQKMHRFITCFWDTLGELYNPELSSAYFKCIVGVIYVFDLTNLESVKNLRRWKQKIMEHNSNKVIPLLLGNKKDLVFLREVDKKEIEMVKREMQIQSYEEVSALDENGGIQQAIYAFFNKIAIESQLGLKKPTKLRKNQVYHNSCI